MTKKTKRNRLKIYTTFTIYITNLPIFFEVILIFNPYCTVVCKEIFVHMKCLILLKSDYVSFLCFVTRISQAETCFSKR
jgi:hypothetical protein